MIESRKIQRISEFADWFTDSQRVGVMAKLAQIDGLEKVTGHNDYAQRLCPGFRVKTYDWL